jgi:hypothetical protein
LTPGLVRNKMMTLCGYTKLWDSTKEALNQYASDAVFVQHDKDDYTGWWREISARWEGTEDLLLVEQDIIIHSQVIPQLCHCKEPWCVFPFPIPSDWDSLQYHGIGCTRFSAYFQRQVPVELIEAQGGSCWECLGKDPKCWRHIDGRISDAAITKNFKEPHKHWPPVGHRDHQYKQER